MSSDARGEAGAGVAAARGASSVDCGGGESVVVSPFSWVLRFLGNSMARLRIGN